jgi:hypothetical protein
MISRHLLHHVLAVLVVLLLPAVCRAEQRILYGTTGKVSEGSVLYRINPETGRGTRVNQITYLSQALTVNGMAFDTTDRQFLGQMYIHTGPFSPNYPNTLFALDVTNGVASLIGETELPRVGELAIDAFGATYGWQFGGLNQRIDDLIKFPQDGSGGLNFGDSGIVTEGNIGIDFDRTTRVSTGGTLYMVNFKKGVQGEIITLNTGTGAGVALRHVDPTAFICSSGKFDPDSFVLFGSWRYWCAEDAVDSTVNLNSRIQVIDITTGWVNRTFVSNMDNLGTLAWTFTSSAAPSRQPSRRPSTRPSRRPSARPSRMPSRRPSAQPSASNMPSAALPPGVMRPSFWYWLVSFLIGILVLRGAGVVIPQGGAAAAVNP